MHNFIAASLLMIPKNCSKEIYRSISSMLSGIMGRLFTTTTFIFTTLFKRHFLGSVYTLSSPVLQQNLWWRVATNQQCQSTKGKTKHWNWQVASPHPFFIHHQTPDGSGVTPLISALRRQHLHLFI